MEDFELEKELTFSNVST